MCKGRLGSRGGGGGGGGGERGCISKRRHQSSDKNRPFCKMVVFIVHQLYKYILRDFKNAPFYILCLFHMIDLRMFSLSFFILLQNGP